MTLSPFLHLWNSGLLELPDCRQCSDPCARAKRAQEPLTLERAVLAASTQNASLRAAGASVDEAEASRRVRKLPDCSLRRARGGSTGIVDRRRHRGTPNSADASADTRVDSRGDVCGHVAIVVATVYGCEVVGSVMVGVAL